MTNKYVIRWKSKVNGRAGRGTKLFEKAEAEQLVEELNREYPQIEHEIMEVEPGATEPATTTEPAEEQQPVSNPASLPSIV